MILFLKFLLQVFSKDETQVVCACTHLTAFSALLSGTQSSCEVFFLSF